MSAGCSRRGKPLSAASLMMSALLAGTDMSPTRLLRLMGPAALLAAWVCTGDAAHTIGSGIGGSRTGLLRPLPSELAVSASEDRPTPGDGRIRCYGGARSARGLCARMRGGSMAEVIVVGVDVVGVMTARKAAVNARWRALFDKTP